MWSIERLFEVCKGGSDESFSIIYPFLEAIKKYSSDKKEFHYKKLTEANLLALFDKCVTKEAKRNNENNSRAKTKNPDDSSPFNFKKDVAVSTTDSFEMKNEVKQTNELKNEIDAGYISFAPIKFSLSDSIDFKKYIPKSLNLVTDHGNIVVKLSEE